MPLVAVRDKMEPQSPNYYDVLEVQPGATIKEITEAYRRAAHKLAHCDPGDSNYLLVKEVWPAACTRACVHGSARICQCLLTEIDRVKAYDVLTDETSRRKFEAETKRDYYT